MSAQPGNVGSASPLGDERQTVARALRLVAFAVAGVLALAGVALFVSHAATDPLVDLRAYWDAGHRLNDGQPLYQPGATSSTGLYLYPPLVAILFRPLALLPFEAAAAIWMAAMVASLALTLRRIGLRGNVLIALGLLGIPLGWALAIGQAEPLITLLLTLGSPWSVALAGHLKLAPWLAAVFWVGRRDWRSLRLFAAWTVAIGVIQVILEPAATLAYLRFDWIPSAFGVRNFSPWAIHPLLWAAIAGTLLVGAFLLARRQAGWPLAVVLAVLAYPRLLTYQLLTLLAAFGGPRSDAPAAQTDD